MYMWFIPPLLPPFLLPLSQLMKTMFIETNPQPIKVCFGGRGRGGGKEEEEDRGGESMMYHATYHTLVHPYHLSSLSFRNAWSCWGSVGIRCDYPWSV
jgi:hypothetical protein